MRGSTHEPGLYNLMYTAAPRVEEVCASCGKEGGQGRCIAVGSKI